MGEDISPRRPHKPMRDASGQIEFLKSKGVTFDLCSEEEAAHVLSAKNNLFRIASFRVLFQRRRDRDGHLGTYIGLDFKYLLDLSYLDQEFRSILRSLSLDVEHYRKVAMLDRISGIAGEDGYGIVADYRDGLDAEHHRRLEGAMAMARRSAYCGSIVDRYWPDMPVWAFFEVASFGVFLDFCRFCSHRWDDGTLMSDYYMLLRAKDVRNAASHGNCIINRFAKRPENQIPPLRPSLPEVERRAIKREVLAYRVQRDLRASDISDRSWKGYVSNRAMRDVVTLLWLFAESVPEGRSRDTAKSRLLGLRDSCGELRKELGRTNRAVTCMGFLSRVSKAFGVV